MASSTARTRLPWLILPLLLAAGTVRAGDDGAMPAQQPRGTPFDVATTAAIAPGAVPATQPVDLDAVRAAVAAYRRGAREDGDRLAGGVADPAARTMLEWVAIRSGASLIPFSRLDAFLRANPNYPGTPLIRRRAEEALIAERKSAAVVRSFLHGQNPASPAGRVALALALDAEGASGAATELVRRVWRQDHLGQPLETLVLKHFGERLERADHRLRAERYVFRGNGTAALRNAARVSPDYVALARARLASAKAKRPAPATLIASVPAPLRGDLSFAFLQAQQARRENRFDEAAKALSGIPRDPALLGDGDEWWVERRVLARKLLDAGDAVKAYEVAAGHGAEDAPERIDAEWHAGFIALRFRDDAALALAHFDAAAALAETPISVARAAYWQGRAAEALGRGLAARAAFERAAEHPVAYYGQLARARLDLPDLPLRRTAPLPLGDMPGYRGARLLYAAGARDLAGTLVIDLAQRLHTTAALESLAGLALREGDVRTLLTLGKQALQRGFPLDMAAFPTIGVPDFPVLGDPMERAIVHAIARQESAFDPTAVSHAGARGLMQMMPATARETARRAGLPFDWPKLGRDALYSARMGAAHLNDLLKEWRGSYILAFAAYNAGSGNVQKWIAAYGDPRDPAVDAVDWVERIPFYETRNYVQRVMENLQVYRQRLDQRTAYLIDHDLKRGRKRE